jgi:hypothetical protein
VNGTPIASIDAAHRQVLVGNRKVEYDSFIGVPVHVPPAAVKASKLGPASYRESRQPGDQHARRLRESVM